MCPIQLRQDQMVLILLTLKLLLLKSKSRQYHRKLRDEFALLVPLSVLQVEVPEIQDTFVSVAVVLQL